MGGFGLVSFSDSYGGVVVAMHLNNMRCNSAIVGPVEQ
jgi:hypothetical protein